MRSITATARWALAVLCLPVAVLALAAFTASTARADRALDDDTNGSFKIFRTSVTGASSRAERTGRRSRGSFSVSSASTDDRPTKSRRAKGRQLASLGGGAEFAAPRPGRSLSGGGNIRWVANADCLNGSLRSAIANVAANYGSVTVTSTCRSASRNAAVGGAKRSYHLTGDAADLRVSGNVSGAAAYLRGLGSGYKHMGGGLFHVDTGPRRSF